MDGVLSVPKTILDREGNLACDCQVSFCPSRFVGHSRSYGLALSYCSTIGRVHFYLSLLLITALIN